MKPWWLDKITITFRVSSKLPRWKMGLQIIPAKHIEIGEDDKRRVWYSSLVIISIPIHYKYKKPIILKLREWGWQAH